MLQPCPICAVHHEAGVPLTFDVWVLMQLIDEIAASSKIPASSLANLRCGSTSETGDCARVTGKPETKVNCRNQRLHSLTASQALVPCTRLSPPFVFRIKRIWVLLRGRWWYSDRRRSCHGAINSILRAPELQTTQASVGDLGEMWQADRVPARGCRLKVCVGVEPML